MLLGHSFPAFKVVRSQPLQLISHEGLCKCLFKQIQACVSVCAFDIIVKWEKEDNFFYQSSFFPSVLEADIYHGTNLFPNNDYLQKILKLSKESDIPTSDICLLGTSTALSIRNVSRNEEVQMTTTTRCGQTEQLQHYNQLWKTCTETIQYMLYSRIWIHYNMENHNFKKMELFYQWAVPIFPFPIPSLSPHCPIYAYDNSRCIFVKVQFKGEKPIFSNEPYSP